MVKAIIKHPKFEMLRPQAIKGSPLFASDLHNKPISCWSISIPEFAGRRRIMTYKWWKPLLSILILRCWGLRHLTDHLFFLHQMFILNQSVVDPCQFLNPRNCPPQAPKMYVYAYIVHFEPTRGEGGHPITIGGGVRQQLMRGVRGIVVDVSI